MCKEKEKRFEKGSAALPGGGLNPMEIRKKESWSLVLLLLSYRHSRKG